MNADSLGPPVLSGLLRGFGRRAPLVEEAATEEAGGVRASLGGKKPPAVAADIVRWRGWVRGAPRGLRGEVLWCWGDGAGCRHGLGCWFGVRLWGVTSVRKESCQGVSEEG